MKRFAHLHKRETPQTKNDFMRSSNKTMAFNANIDITKLACCVKLFKSLNIHRKSQRKRRNTRMRLRARV